MSNIIDFEKRKKEKRESFESSKDDVIYEEASYDLKDLSTDILFVLRTYYGHLNCDEVAGVLATMSRDIAELHNISIEDDELRKNETAKLKYFLCSLVLQKGPIIKKHE